MRTTFPTPEVFHLWANRKHAHRIKGGNVSADGACLYSYTECIGILRDGELPAIVSTYKWSNTTTDHQYKARAALNRNPVSLPCVFPRDGDLKQLARNAREQGMRTLKNIDHGNKARMMNKVIASEYADYCALLDFAHSVDGLGGAAIIDNLQDLRALRDGLLTQDHLARCNASAGRLKLAIDAMRNIIKAEHWSGVDTAIHNAVNMAASVESVTATFEDQGFEVPDYLPKLASKAARMLPKLRAMQAAHAAEQLRINADQIARWRAGESVQLARELPPVLRLYRSTCEHDAGDTIQTSKGATVPASVAPMLWEMVLQARATATTTEHKLTVGHYTLDTVHADGSITVGCHNIAYSELELIAGQLGYI